MQAMLVNLLIVLTFPFSLLLFVRDAL